MAQSYEYSIGSVRAREKQLLTRADIEAMLACKSTEALANYLSDKGYADGGDIDGIIRNSRKETLDYLNTVVPEPSVFDALIYPYDAHNIKSVMKGVLANSDYRRLLLSPCTVDTQDIEKAVKESKYSLLPDFFADACEKAFTTLSHTADARLSDAYIDRACMQAQLKAAQETKIPFLIEYIKTDLFYRNVKTAIRACTTDAPREYYLEALCEGLDGFDKKEIINAAMKDRNTLIDYLSGRDAYRCGEAMARFKKSPAEFEKYTESLLTLLAVDRCKRSGNGAEPALGYFIARFEEYKAVRIIAQGIETGADSEIIRERLREIYG